MVTMAKATVAWVAAGLMLGLFASNFAPAAEGEKLLQGFEEEELQAIAQRFNSPPAGHKGRWNPPVLFEKNGGDIYFLGKGGSLQTRGNWQAMPLHSSAARATQGRMSLQVHLKGARDGMGGAGPAGVRWNGAPRKRPAFSGETLPEVLGSYGTRQHFPYLFTTADWSGFELLRMDVWVDRPQSPKTDTVLVLTVESRDIDHPIRRYCTVPPGKWCTLELDLKAAEEVRGLEPGNMIGLWLRLDSQQKCEGAPKGQTFDIFLDNIRLAPAGAPAANPVVRDETPLDQERPAAYAVTSVPPKERGEMYDWQLAELKLPEPFAVPSAPGPAKTERLEKIDLSPFDAYIGKGVGFTLRSITAAGGDRILVGADVGSGVQGKEWTGEPRDNCAGLLVCTTDGGKRWKGLAGEDKATVYCMKSGVAFFDIGGGDLLNMQSHGCFAAGGGGWAEPHDRVFCRRTVAAKDGWWLSPFFFTGLRGRHCTYLADMGDFSAVALPSGRIWCAWQQDLSALGESGEVHARYSDDKGMSWHSWRGPKISGRLPFKPGGPLQLVPHGGQVALLGKNGWSAFDGKAWSDLKPIGNGGDIPVSAVALKDGTILAGMKSGGVLRLDGGQWAQELPEPDAKLSVCGNAVLAFAAKGNVLECRRRIGGRWTEAEKLAEEADSFARGYGDSGFIVPRYAPDDFAPVAYMTGKGKGQYWPEVNHWIQVLKVPAR